MTMDHSGHRAAVTSAATGGGATYTCPMHAEIIRTEPGNCPICGMTLVVATTAPGRTT